jgi:hypothetical protein
MNDETAIPVFPCASPDETLEFYQTLGFEVTHEQKKPYVYLAVKRGGFDLHFHGGGKPDPQRAAGLCLVMVSDVEPHHRAFAAALKGKLGRVPTAGQPRITRLRKGQSRFTVVDPGGNSIIFIARDEAEYEYPDKEKWAKLSPMERALEMAANFRDMRGMDVSAAKVLDLALAKNPTAARSSVPASWLLAWSWRWPWATRGAPDPRGPIWIRFPCPTRNASGSATSCRRWKRSSGCRDEWSVPVCRKPFLPGSRSNLSGHRLALRPLAWQRRPVSQELKKRSPGRSSAHISTKTKEVRPFHGRYAPRVTDIFVCSESREILRIEHSGRISRT